ncbi:ATP-binding protein [Streptomyces sp. NPDC087422]|uniref:ATP-binding protein n=1 Tax=Streptomyces sp. NPDC087422 TaxID=3365786 RepID=UPI00382CE9AD
MASASFHDRLELACEAGAVPRARGHARGILRSWGVPDDVLYDALVVLGELTTNAVQHAGTGLEEPSMGQGPSGSTAFTLDLRLCDDRLYVAVQDGSRQIPVPRGPSDKAESGRGLQLVADLSHGAWGFASCEGFSGKVVWACLTLSASGTEPAARANSWPGACGAEAAAPLGGVYRDDLATLTRTHTLLALSQADRYLADLPVEDADLDALAAVLEGTDCEPVSGPGATELAPRLYGTLRRLSSRVAPSAGFTDVVRTLLDDPGDDAIAAPGTTELTRLALAVQDLLEQAAACFNEASRSP